jgi:predicted dithiol-disulfide oxidoreductase (DUF899 family)
MLAAVSLAPLEKLLAFKRRMEWTFPWASSVGGDFNFDFCASFTEDQQHAGLEYNFRREPGVDTKNHLRNDEQGPVAELANVCGVDAAAYIRQRPGMSAFVLENGVVYHTYSTYSRGVDSLWGMYPWLDRAPLGRNETGIWWRHHDRYESAPAGPASCCQHATGRPS